MKFLKQENFYAFFSMQIPKNQILPEELHGFWENVLSVINWRLDLKIVFLCIGSDRVTGDCLGPYVGYRLSQHQLPGIFVYGTLSQPVHAVNLSDITDFISKNHPFALVIAIDASLGDERHLGYVTIGNGSLYPGAAVQKDLPPVGDIYITGIVNIAGILEYSDFTDNKHLSTVITLADTIAPGDSRKFYITIRQTEAFTSICRMLI